MTFEAEILEIDEVTKQLKVSIPAELVEAEFDVAIVNVGKSAQVKGFRPGKAPRQMVEQLHGSRVRMEVANKLISTSLKDVIKQHKIETIGLPEIDISSFEPGKNIEFTANVSLFPTPEIKGYEAFNVSVLKREVTDAAVEEEIGKFLENHATPRKLEFRNKAQAGDVIEGQAAIWLEGDEPSRPEPLFVKLGEGRLPDEVEQGLIGADIGEVKEFGVTFPEDHNDLKLRGKKANYRIGVNVLHEMIKPELTDDWVKSLNYGPKTVLELRMEVRTGLEKRCAADTDADIQSKILEQLLERNAFKVPQIIIDDQLRSMIVSAGLVDPNKVDVQNLPVESLRENFGKAAADRARGTIIIDSISKKEGLSATEGEMTEAMQKIASGSGHQLEEVKKALVENKRLVGLALDISRDKVLKMLASRAKVEYTASDVESETEGKTEGKSESKAVEPVKA